MAVSGINNTAPASASASAAPTGAAADSEQRFLKLLVTQLNNQDPLNPLDNAQLTSQLAQMSTVSGIEKLNGALQSLIAQSSSGQVLQAASLVGRTVLVPGDRLTLEDGAAAPFAVESLAAADSVKATIVDGAGRVVRSYDAGALPMGVHNLSWDGLDDQGKVVPAGAYRVSVTATQGGSAVAAEPLVYQRVESVAQGAGGITLDIGNNRKAGLGEVRLIQ
jgi:flagellar basal-body rod modification protein FlgD